MKTRLAILLAICLPLAIPAADQLNPELQRGLFEEEANQNFAAAIKAYQSVLTTHDGERKLAATALFRLGECYRKLGKTNDAISQYQRLVTEFPDQATLANLSRQNLVGLGAPRATDTRGTSSERARFLEQALSGLQLEAAQAVAVLKPLQSANRIQRRNIAPTLAPDAVLNRLLAELSQAEQRAASLETKFTRDHPDVRAVRSTEEVLNQQIDTRIDGIMEGLKLKSEALSGQVAELKKELAELTKPASTDGGRSATGPDVDPAARTQLKELLQSELAIATQFAAEQRKKIETGTLPKGEEVRFERDVLNLKRQLVAAEGLVSAKDRQEWRELLLQEIQLAEEAARLEKQKLENGRTVASEVARLQRDVLILKRELVAFDAAPPSGAGPVEVAAAAAPSPEAQELALSERLLAQLQGWDLSQLRKLIPTLAPDAEMERLERDLTVTEGELRSREALGINTEENARHRDELRKRTADQTKLLAVRADEIVMQLEKRIVTLRERVARQQPRFTGSFRQPPPAESTAPTDEEEKEIRRIQALIKDSPDLINAKSVDVGMYGESRRYGMPLHKAAQQGQLMVARFLIDNHADLNARDGFGRTPLHWAALNGHKSMAELLLSRGAEPNAGVLAGANTGSAGFTPLHFAAQNGYRNVCEALLAGKTELNARTENYLFTPLHLAAERGFTSVAELLLAKGAEVNARNTYGSTPLENAAGAGMKTTVQLLLTNKADVNTQNAQGGTPLHAAVSANRDDVVRLLLANKANPNLALNDKAGNSAAWTPLSAAVSQEDVSTVRLLLEHGADPNALFSRSGWTVLMQAAIKGGLELAEALVAAGADVNAISRSDARTTALYFVTANNPTNAAAIVELLLKNKADVNVADAAGLTPLIHAVTKRNAAVVKLLVENGADVNVLTRNGNTPLSLIKQAGPPGLSAGFANPVAYSPIPGAPGLPGQSESAVEDSRLAIISLLEQRGARDDLLRLTAVSTTRNHENRRGWFFKGTNDWNRFTLFELIAWINPRQGINTGLDFPDLSRVVVSRIDPRTAKTEDLRFDLAVALTNSDCAKDLTLEWGDVVNIPELDHFVDARWHRLPDAYYETFQKCLERTVRVSIKGQATTVVLTPFRFDNNVTAVRGGPNPWEARMSSFRLNQFLRGSGLLLTSSDVTRVKVKRTNPATREIRERVFDLDQPSLRNDDTNDLWLRDGDFIEVPEK